MQGRKGQPAVLGLTELTTEELKRLLRHIYKEELPCPVRADTLACVGFQHRGELILGALRGLSAEAARAVLVCVIAERMAQEEAARASTARNATRLPADRRHAAVANTEEVDWTETHDSAGALRHRRKRLGQATEGRKLGASLIELPPGQRAWPHHAHLANEEAIYVLSGRPMLRLGREFIELHPGDYISLPPGEAHAHQLINGADGPARYLCLSTMEDPDVVLYPDSGKVGVIAGSAPGGSSNERVLTAFFRRSAETDYWTDET